MSNELVQKPSSSSGTLDKFRALLGDRDDGLKISDDDIVPPASTDEIVRLYEVVLSDLIFNSKPLITDLTIIAGDQREHGEGIADAICARIIEAPLEQKLPSFYLLDSIVKNIGKEYVRHFSTRLPEVFCEAYRQVEPNLYPALRHLFSTWSTVFPQSVLLKVEDQLQLSLRTNCQSPRPTRGIHVNPKYMEARNKFEQSTADNNTQDERGTYSNLRIYARKTANGYAKYDYDHSEVVSSQIGFQQVKPFPPSNAKLARPSSRSTVAVASSLSPLANEFSVGNSPRKFIEGVSPSPSESNYDKFETFANSHNNGRDLEGPRALIDAYGNDGRKRLLTDRSQKVARLDVDGINNKVATKTWQNTEEEEYDWEVMSPTVGNSNRSNDLSSSCVLPPQRFGARLCLGSGWTTPFQSELMRSNWSGQAQLPIWVNSAPFDDDSSYALWPGRGPMSKVSESQNERNHISVSHYPRDIPKHPSWPSQDSFEGTGFQLHTLSSRILPTAAARIPAVLDDVPDSCVPSFTGSWAPLNLSRPHPLPSLPIFPHEQIKGQFDLANSSYAVGNQVLLNSFSPISPSLPNKPMNHVQMQVPSQESGENLDPYHLGAPPPLIHGYASQGLGTPMNSVLFDQIPHVHTTLPIQNIPNSSQMIIPNPQGPIMNNKSPGNVFPGVISSLMAQGLISLPKQVTAKESVGVEFNPDMLKIRHESVIKALYADLPRQCTTCGLRFKSQEEHRSHMDWHVTKNRMSKNRKQKSSRTWFVNTAMWLSSAEALGTDVVPGFLSTETVSEKTNGEEMAVPADEDQNLCALCGEPFDEFFSDETDEWMYRGAVCMNAPNGVTAGMDRSCLGPIVHAKCRSESSLASPEDFVQQEGVMCEMDTHMNHEGNREGIAITNGQVE